MHALILTPQFPYPPHQGTTLRNYHLIRHLAERHVIDLFSLLARGDDPGAEPVQKLVRHLVTAPQPARTLKQRLRDLLLSPLPDMALRLWDEAAFARLRAHIEAHPPDVVQVEGIEMAPYLLALQQAGVALPRVVYDAHNAETLLQRRAFLADARRPRRWIPAAYSAVQTMKLSRYERRVLLAVDAVAAVSDADAAELRRLAPDIHLEVVTNGVDLAFYDPDADYPNPYPRSGPNLVFTGKMDFRPNIDAALWFAERVLPQLHATNLNPHFWIVGRDPHPRLDKLRRRPDITITGPVPDTRPYLAHADLYVVPLLAGGGTRLKILESLAMALPVVSTRLGAEGFPLKDGEHLALVDSPDEFRRRCETLLRDPQQAREMGLRGRRFVEQHYGWERIAPRMEQLYSG